MRRILKGSKIQTHPSASSTKDERPPIEEERWSDDVATLRRAAQELVLRRSQQRNPGKPLNPAFDEMAHSLDDPSADVRRQAVRDLYELDPDQAATLVNDALRAGTPDERRRIGNALADSGLLYEAIDDLMAANHESCYGAFSLLFLVAKAGVVEPLSTVIEQHPSFELRLAVIRLLASSGEPEVAPALQRLAANTSLAPELRSAAAEAVAQLNG
jgi:HEAT repeat protein